MATQQRIPTKQAPRDAKQYLDQLDQLLKRNTGSGTFIGQDTSSNIPMYLPGKVANPTGLSETPSLQSRSVASAPTPTPRPEPEVYQEPETPQGDVLGATSEQNPIEAFFSQSIQNVYQPKQQSQEYMEKLYQATGQAYGVQSMNNGMVLMNDGSVVDPNVEVFPIASDVGGGIKMSDGSVRNIDPKIAQYLRGPQGLSQALFGGQQAITQEFGNYNPELEPGSGYNMGTDFRTRDLQNRNITIPYDAEVVQVLTDDGTRFGDISGHQGYGNSILLRLPTGEMLRLSHLSQLPNVQEGQRVSAGSLSVIPGATGNTTGEHLDLEYYNEQGQISDPSAFDATRMLPYMGTQPEQIKPPTASAPQAPQMSQQPKQYNPFRQLVGNVAERIGDTLGIPEGTFSEAIAGGATKRTNQALADEIGGERPEAVPGIRQNIRDIGSQIKTAGQETLSQAGEGLKNLGQSGIDSLGNVFKPKQDVAKRAVGDVAGTTGSVLGATSSLMDNTPSMQSMSKNDIRDPFFKTGGSETYKNFLKPNAQDISGGALSLDLFNDEFYQNPENIKNVFGGTFLAPQAQQRFDTYEAEKRKAEEETRRQEEQSKPKPSLQDYLNQGKTTEQWYAETGQQSTLDSARSGGINPQSHGQLLSQDYPRQGNYTPAQAQSVGSTSGRGVQSVTNTSGRTVQAAPGSGLRVDSSGGVQQVKVGNTPVSQQSAQLAYKPVKPQSSPTSNIFSRATSAIKNIFRR